jgi:PKD repeat protein
MKQSQIVKLQAITMVLFMMTSGLLVLVNLESDSVRGEDTTHSGTWLIDSDYTIEAGDTVYVHDVDGLDEPEAIFPAGTGVVIGTTSFDGATLTIEGTLIIEDGDLWVGGNEPPIFALPRYGVLLVDGGTILIQSNGDPTRSINGNGPIEIYDGTIQNNGTDNDGDGSDSDTFRFIANSSLTIMDSLVEDLSGSNVVTQFPETVIYTGGIHIRHPTSDTRDIFYQIEDSIINNSKVGISFENTPFNKGYYSGVSITNTDTHLNLTGSAPILMNFSTEDDWVIWVQDDVRENYQFDFTNESHLIMVNSGDVATDDVNLYHGSVDPVPIMALSDSTVNVSAMVDIIVEDQAGNPVVGAAIQVDDSLYDLTDTPNRGQYITNSTVFSGFTDSKGIAASVAIPLYTIFGHVEFLPPPPEPGSLDQTMYKQSLGDWNTTATFSDVSTAIRNGTADPIDLDTDNIIMVVNLKPNFNSRPFGLVNDPAVAGDVIQFRHFVRNDGSMGGNFTVKYYIDAVHDDNLIEMYDDIWIGPKGASDNEWRLPEGTYIEWNTTRDMGDQMYTIFGVVYDLTGYETSVIDNTRTFEFYLERPTPLLDVDINFDNIAPTDGDNVKIFANITNNGMAEADDIMVSYWYGDPMAGGVQIGANQTFSGLDVGAFKELNITWDTLHMANDTIFTGSIGSTFVDHDIHVWVEYNNIEDPNPLKTKNTTEFKTLRVNKFYNVDFQPATQFDYINEEVPYTIYAFEVKNTGRAIDSFEFDVDEWVSNNSHINDWDYVIYTDDHPDLEANGGIDIPLYPGQTAIIYVNISAEWNNIEQGELHIVHINASSVNSTARMTMVKASTSAGTVDYTPTEIIFRREDGVRAQNDGTSPDSDLKSLVANETSTLTVQIKNEGTAGSVFSFNVTFYVDVFGSPIPIGSTIFSGYIPAGFFDVASIDYVFTVPGLQKISVQVDSNDDIGELYETNNWFNSTIYVKNESAAEDFTISGIVFDWDGQTPLPGATVRLRNNMTGYIDTTISDSKGRYTFVLPQEFYNDNDPIFIRATHPPDPAEDSTTLSFYSEDLFINNVDFYLFVFGVDLTIQPRLEYNVSFVREDGKYTNQPIVGEETIIRFWIVNRGTVGTNATYQITKNGTSSVNLIGDPATTFSSYESQSITIVEYKHTFSDAEIVDIDINVVDDNALETYTVNNIGRRTRITIKSRLTNKVYDITGTVFERASGSENVFAADANVTITNTRTDYSFTTTSNDFGRFSYDLRNLPLGYEEGDLIHVRAWKEDKEGTKEFYAYSEDFGIDLVIVFATYDVRVIASDVRQEVAPGDFTTFEIVVFNTGNVNDKFQLSLDGPYADWGTLDTYEVSIGAGMSVSLLLIVDVPADYNDAPAGVVAHIIVVAVSNDGNGPSDTVDIYTEIAQVYDILIDVGTTAGHALPGDSVSYMITIQNNGNGQDIIRLAPTGTHSSWGELSESILVIDAGTTLSVTLTVSIPDFTIANDNAAFQVSAFSQGGFSENTPVITTTVEEFNGVELTVGSPTQYGDPDVDVIYFITVYNRGNSQQTMNFNIGGAGNGVISQNPVIPGFSSVVVSLSVHIPSQAKANEVINNLVSAYLASDAGVESNTISINTVVNGQYDVPALGIIGAPEKSIWPSKTVTFTLEVTNNANTDDTFSFAVTNSNSDFLYSIPSLAIASRTSGTVDLVVSAPSNAVFLDHATLDIQAVSSKGLKSDSKSVTVNVTQYVYGVEIDISGAEKEKKINLGESVSHTIQVKNIGDFTNYSSQISLEITNLDPAEADWIIDVPTTIALSQGDEMMEASVFVRVPSTSNTRTSISFNVRARVNLPKSVEGSETNPQYFDEIVGIVTIVNQKPTVNILPPQGDSYPVYYYKEPLQFEAAAFDPDGDSDAITYEWDFGDGSDIDEANTAPKPSHSFAFPGTYQVALTVVDEFGESNTAIRTIKVANQKPEVSVVRTIDGETKFKKGPVTFEVVPIDEDPNSLDYTWYFGDGTVATISNEVTITHTYTRTGSITVTCVAFDEFGGFGSNSLTIDIENNAPVPAFKVIYDGKTYDYNEDVKIVITEGDEVFFDASSSFDPDSEHGDKIVSFNWVFGDGTNGSGVQPTHIYKEEFKDGYEISLFVIDSEGKGVPLKGALLIEVEKEGKEIPIEVWMMIGVLLAIVLFLIILFVRTPKKFFGAMKKGTAQAELSALIEKLNTLENQMAVGGGAAAAGSTFAPGPQKFCNNCGAGNEPDGKFCETCGQVLN